MFDDDSLREEEIQDLCINEESQEDVYEPQPLENSIVKPPPIKYDHIYEDLMWLTPPPQTLASIIHANQAHTTKPNHVEHTCLILPRRICSVVRHLLWAKAAL